MTTLLWLFTFLFSLPMALYHQYLTDLWWLDNLTSVHQQKDVDMSSPVFVLSKNDNCLVIVQILQGSCNQYSGSQPNSLPAPIFALLVLISIGLYSLHRLSEFWLVKFFKCVKPCWRFPRKLEQPKKRPVKTIPLLPPHTHSLEFFYTLK